MITYPDDYNPIFEYYSKIESGEIVVSSKVKVVYQYIVECLNNPDCEFYYDSNKANKVIEYVERYCKHSKGEWGGKPILLELWQKASIACMFGLINKLTGLRQIKETFLLVARKNGKSLFASTIGLFCLTADNEKGAEVVSLATKRDQAKIVWDESVKMIKKSPTLYKRTKCLVSEIKYKDSNFKPLSSESKGLDGLNISAAIVDEIHEMRDKNLYDVVVDGCASRRQPVILIISTAGTHRTGIFDIKYEQAEILIKKILEKEIFSFNFLPLFYELDSESEYLDEQAWIKANPNLNVSKSYEYLREEVQKAKEQPILKTNLLCKHFNVRQNASSAWMTYEQLKNIETFELEEFRDYYALGGVDISSTTDLTSACILLKSPKSPKIYFKHMYWMPAENVEERGLEDDVPYSLWAKQGYIRLCQGNKVNPSDITAWFKEIQEKYEIYLYRCGYDSWGSQMWVQEMKDTFCDEVPYAVIQGAKTLSEPMKMLSADLKSKLINYDNNPVTFWCLTNTSVEIDKNNNIKPCKSNQRRRIDGLASMLDAYVVYRNNQDFENLNDR